ncbi:Uncharacterised protein [Salmonella enterica subsp. enterica]|uniref:Uncharacterized protein n=1 Tax=Salmonella enterica I TaxID=59201 RepID=A0A379W1N5_SALET|nr:Uncharacterised protein [Salmonella enterica subsp. enterica]
MMKKNHITRTIIASAVLFPLTLQQRRHILKRVTMQWVVPG